MLGLLLLVVPGVLLMAMWSVAVPVMAEERRGVLAALRRSRDLTRGALAPICAVVILVFGSYVVAKLALEAIIEALGGGPFEGLEQGRRGFGALYWAAVTAQAILTAVLYAIYAALFIELRDWKDGPAADRLADKFS